MTTTSSTTSTTTVTSSSTAPSLLRTLLSTPSASSHPPPTFDDLLTRPGPSSAPPPTFDSLQRQLSSSAPPSSTSSAPPPPTIEDDIPIFHLSDDEWEMVPVSTAHPNYWDPELHHLVVEELLGTNHYRLPEISAPSLPEKECPPHPSSRSSPPSLPSPPPSPTLQEMTQCPPDLSPLPLSPSSSPPSSPLPQLPVRRIKFSRLQINTAYKIKNWNKVDNKLHMTIFNREETELFSIILPNAFHRPTRQQRHHHLFEGNLYLHVTKLNKNFHFTFHP